MSVQIFIIDDNAKFRVKLTQLLKADWPGARIEQFDPTVQGWPGEIDWAQYDLVLLDYFLQADNGLEWYEVLKHNPGFPPTIIMSTQPDAEVAVRVIKAGAENYLPKSQMTRQKLKEVVQEIFNRGHKPVRAANIAIETEDQATAIQENSLPILDEDSQLSADKENENNITGNSDDDGRKAKIIRLPQKTVPPPHAPVIQGYKILKRIGRGGMSNIYLAERESDKKQLVVKALSANLIDNKKTVMRANQEFKLISRIKNRNIVELIDQGTSGDMLYTIMEYFPGGDLKQRLQQGINQRQALTFLKQIAEGLNAIHGCGIIHRDLKPGNIMFRADDSLAIIDFGISKDINSTLDLTNPGQIMGTPNYMAPEQGKGAYKPDARSDIYSLGILLYEMLTGKKPYAAPSGAAILYKHLHDPIPHLPNQFYEVQPLIDKMLGKFPHQRFQSAYDLIQFIDKEFRWDITLDFN